MILHTQGAITGVERAVDSDNKIGSKTLPLSIFHDCTLTIELASKWYELFLIDITFKVYSVDFEVLEKYCDGNKSAFVDHCPNPSIVDKYAEAMGYHIPEIALELMWGRWVTEVEGRT